MFKRMIGLAAAVGLVLALAGSARAGVIFDDDFNDTVPGGSNGHLHDSPTDNKLGDYVNTGSWAYPGTWGWDTAKILTDGTKYLWMTSGHSGRAGYAVMASAGSLSAGVTVSFVLEAKPWDQRNQGNPYISAPFMQGYDANGNELFQLRFAEPNGGSDYNLVLRNR